MMRVLWITAVLLSAGVFWESEASAETRGAGAIERLRTRREDLRRERQLLRPERDVFKALEDRYGITFREPTTTPDCPCKSVGLYRGKEFLGDVHLELLQDPRGTDFQKWADQLQRHLSSRSGAEFVSLRYGDGSLADYLRISGAMKREDNKIGVNEVTGEITQRGQVVDNFKDEIGRYRYWVSVNDDGKDIEFLKIPTRRQ
ncbi:MAG: hypothetical protein HY078_11690 [Elusimicrobia bacterium]|nr:hypothetical protein [Elusimicrobiota bacterium]